MPSIAGALGERKEQVRILQARGAKVVGVLAALAPPLELLEAAGGVPFRLLWGGAGELETRGLRLLKNEACSLLKGILGAVSSGEGVRPDAVVVGGACDQLRRSAELFSRDLGVPAFELDVPRAHRVPGAAERLRAEFEWLGEELAEFAGAGAFDPGRLKDRIRAWNEARRALRLLDEARRAGKADPAAVLEIARASWILEPETVARLAGELLGGGARVEPAPDGPPSTLHPLPSPPLRAGRACPGARLLLTGPPVLFGDDLAAAIVAKSGKGWIAGDVSETGLFPHLEEIDEAGDPLAALAEAANRFPLGCGFKRPDDAFLEAVRRAARDASAEAILCKGLSFCAPWNHQAARFRNEFGLPFLALEGDYSEGQESRLRTRIEAFLEALERRDGGKRPS
jgi:benzoyl-CoA reductase/2-hydroxyglutaryl-CoA dehydratase subunit BcrC/BadD/HgdB